MKKLCSLLLVFLLFPLMLSAVELGVKWEFAGGPVFSAVIFQPISQKFETNLSAGGFPGIIFRSDANIKYKKERMWIPFYQAGAGIMSFFRGNADGKTIITFHANTAIRTYKFMDLNWTPYLGLIYVPDGLNKNFKDDLSDIDVVPMLGMEIKYCGG